MTYIGLIPLTAVQTPRGICKCSKCQEGPSLSPLILIMSIGSLSEIMGPQPATNDNSLLALVDESESESSLASDATAPNLPGPGRTVGLLLDWLGTRLEVLVNRIAIRNGHGPAEIAREIRRLRHHRETSFQSRLEGALNSDSLSNAEMRSLRRLCDRLLKYARFVTPS